MLAWPPRPCDSFSVWFAQVLCGRSGISYPALVDHRYAIQPATFAHLLETRDAKSRSHITRTCNQTTSAFPVNLTARGSQLGGRLLSPLFADTFRVADDPLEIRRRQILRTEADSTDSLHSAIWFLSLQLVMLCSAPEAASKAARRGDPLELD